MAPGYPRLLCRASVGDPEAILAPLHYALIGFSRLLALNLIHKGYEVRRPLLCISLLLPPPPLTGWLV